LSICGKREFSRQKYTDDHDKVNHRNIWYWRFKEASPTDYENMPVLTAGNDKDETVQKRRPGRPAKQEQ
jgi:hypothetical protein